MLAEQIAAAAGMAAGMYFGRRQLLRWGIWSRKNMAVMAAASCIVFFAGGFLMSRYGYHFLKIIRYWALMYGLLLTALVDGAKRIIPNKALLAMAGLRTVLLLGECACFPGALTEIILSAGIGLFGGGLLFLLPGALVKKGIGMGDVKLIAVMGYFLGFQVLMSALILILTLTVFAGLFALLLKKASLRSEMPFAPFAAAGTMVTILMGF